MSEFQIALASIQEVRQFVNAASRSPCEVDVCAGRYVVDGKSIMGLFSLDLSRPVTVRLYGSDGDQAALRRAVEGLLAR